MSELLPEVVWCEIEPLLPPLPPPSPKGGRPPVTHRQALTGIIFLLKTGLPWQAIPKELGCGSGSTCWRRFQKWTAAGLWPRVHEKLLGLLGRRRQIDLSRVVVDSASVRRKKGAQTGPNPTDRAKKGCKRHLITDAAGIPLVVQTGPANERDEQRLGPMLDRLPAIPGPRGRPRRKPGSVQGDAGYGFPHVIAEVRQRRITSLLALRGTPGHPVAHGSGLGRTRYVIERTLSWFGNFRRIKFCYERWGEHFQAFHDLAACLICAQAPEPGP